MQMVTPPIVTDYVRRTGDTMTGNLAFAAGQWVVGSTKVITGTYVGNGADNRNINIGIDLTAKSNVWVIVKNIPNNATGAHRIEYAQGDSAARFDANPAAANIIQQFTATGFEVGSNVSANQNTATFMYVVMYSEP